MPHALLEPRIYRAAFIPALFALIILAFSLQDPAAPLTPELAPPTFSGQRAVTSAKQLTENYGARPSGTQADSQVADLVRARLTESGFVTSEYRFDAKTLRGKRKLINVLGVRAGPSDRRLVIIASRDGSPGALRGAGAAETGILLELARVLQGRTFNHTLVLASVSGGVDGGLGANELARKLRRPVDAVIAVRNVAAPADQRMVLSEYDSRLRSDPRFERTADRLAQIELRRSSGARPILAQFVRMGFPIALGEQATFPGNGLSAVSFSPGGESLAPVDFNRTGQVAATGRSALRALTTFDGSFRPAPPQPDELRIGSKLIPGWALILLIGMLLLPLIVSAVDGWARARRRGSHSLRGLVMVPLVALVVMIGAVILRSLGAVGLIDSPPLPVEPSAATAVLPLVSGVLIGLLTLIGAITIAAATRRITPRGGQAGFALWLVFAGVALFFVNPIAAGFWMPLLHLMLIMVLAGTRPRRAQVWLTALIGALPLIAMLVYYPVAFEADLIGAVRFAVLLEAGGFIGLAATAVTSLLIAAVFATALQLHWTAPRRTMRAPAISPLID